MNAFTRILCLSMATSIYLAYGLDTFYENIGPHKGEATDCRGSRMQLDAQMRQVKCMPRETLVKLRPEPGYAYFPDTVSVDRCDGHCVNNFSCMPIKSSNISIFIRRHHLNTRGTSCYRVQVEKHWRCKCGCNVMKESCNKYQVYLDNDCTCKCMNFKEEFECIAMKKNMVWNSESCKCMCGIPEEECSSGLIWVPALCRCAEVMHLSFDEIR